MNTEMESHFKINDYSIFKSIQKRKTEKFAVKKMKYYMKMKKINLNEGAQYRLYIDMNFFSMI